MKNKREEIGLNWGMHSGGLLGVGIRNVAVASALAVGVWAGQVAQVAEPIPGVLGEPGLARPVFVEHPKDRLANVGEDVILSVALANPNGWHYQWLRNGIPIPKEGSTRLRLKDFQPEDGGTYSVLVFKPNDRGAGISDPARVRAKGKLTLVEPSFEKRLKLKDKRIRLQGNNDKGANRPETSEPWHVEERAAKSVWVEWTAPDSAGVLNLDTGGSSFDTRLAVYELRPSARGKQTVTLKDLDAEAVTYDDDGGPWQTSALKFNAEPKQRYFIAVDGKAEFTDQATNGNFLLRLEWKESEKAPLVIKRQPQNVVVEGNVVQQGAPGIFRVKMEREGNYQFTWYKEGKAPALKTERNRRESELRIDHADVKAVGRYYATIRDLGASQQTTRSQSAALSYSVVRVAADAAVRPAPAARSVAVWQSPVLSFFGLLAPAPAPGNAGILVTPLGGSKRKVSVCNLQNSTVYYGICPTKFCGPNYPPEPGTAPNPNNKNRVLISTTNCVNFNVDTTLRLCQTLPPHAQIGGCANDDPTAKCGPLGTVNRMSTLRVPGLVAGVKYTATIYYNEVPAGTNIEVNWEYY